MSGGNNKYEIKIPNCRNSWKIK